MIIVKFDFKIFKSELSENFESAHGNYIDREYLIIRLVDSDGTVGYGEAAPLPGFSKEIVKDIVERINEIKSGYIRLEYNDNFLDNALALSCYDDLPSLRSAIEQAIFNILLQKQIPPTEIFERPIATSVPVNSIIGFENPDSIRDIIHSQINAGYKTIKLKVGREDFTDDKFFIDTLLKNTDSGIKIRLDPNCNWKYPKILEYVTQFDNSRIEYIEQPDSHVDDLLLINKKCKIPVATDECVQSLNDARYAIGSGIKYMVIKPMFVGGLINSFKILKFAECRNVKVIFSSLMEGNIGFQVPSLLAGLTKHNLAHGLGIITKLRNSYVSENFTVSNGTLTVKNLNSPARCDDFDQ